MIALALALALSGSAWAEGPDRALEERAVRLAELRAEVAALSDRLEDGKDELQAELRALDAQRIDLEVQVRREELRLAQLGQALDEQRARAGADAEAEAALRPQVLAAAAEIRAVVASGLPYRVIERSVALDEITRAVEDGRLAPSQAAGRLWAFVEDELRLARENTLDRQVIALEGRDVLVDVARFGMVGLFFRAQDGRVGMATRDGDAWTWVVVEDRAGRDAIVLQLDALAKGIRTGWTELPYGFPEVTR